MALQCAHNNTRPVDKRRATSFSSGTITPRSARLLDELSKYDAVVPPARCDSVDAPCLVLLVLFYLLPAYRLPCGTLLLLILSVRFGRAPPVQLRDTPPEYELVSDSDDDYNDDTEQYDDEALVK